jgi:RNA polymerase sigma-70 factor (ECF subfamily)
VNTLARDNELQTLLPQLRSFALRLCGRPDDAEDLVQETLLRALDRGRMAAPELKPWLMRVLKNLFVDQWRRRRMRDAADVTCAFPPPANDTPLETPKWATVDSTQLGRAVDALAPEFRSVYRLHAQGQDYDAIAAQLGLRKATVGTRLFRARRKLRKLLIAA